MAWSSLLHQGAQWCFLLKGKSGTQRAPLGSKDGHFGAILETLDMTSMHLRHLVDSSLCKIFIRHQLYVVYSSATIRLNSSEYCRGSLLAMMFWWREQGCGFNSRLLQLHSAADGVQDHLHTELWVQVKMPDSKNSSKTLHYDVTYRTLCCFKISKPHQSIRPHWSAQKVCKNIRSHHKLDAGVRNVWGSISLCPLEAVKSSATIFIMQHLSWTAAHYCCVYTSMQFSNRICKHQNIEGWMVL